MESVNETPMKRKRGRPRKTDTQPQTQPKQPKQHTATVNAAVLTESLQKLLDVHQKKVLEHIDKNADIKNTINDVSKDLSEILINILKKIDQVKSLTKEITREELIKEIVRDELSKIYQDEASEIEILKKELSDMKERFNIIYERINIPEETSAEM